MDTSYRRFTVIVFFILFSTVLASEPDKRPKWVDQVPNNPELLQGIGLADDTGSPESDQKRADVNAITQIINEISTSVSSSLTDFYQEDSQTGQSAKTLEIFTKISSQFAQETISGIKIAGRYCDAKKKVYYAYAVITREELENQFKARADNAIRLCQDYHRYAQKALLDGNIFGALNNYNKALAELFVVQANLKQNLTGDLDNSGKKEMLQVRLENEIGKILPNVYFQVISGDGQVAQRNRGLTQALTGKVVYQSDTKTYPLSNLPIGFRFINSTGKASEGVTTDIGGTFSGNVSLIESASSEIGTVRAGIYFPELEAFRNQVPNLFKIIEQVGCDFKFKIDVAGSVRTFVYICEDIDGNPVPRAYSTGEIIKALIQNKFTVINPGQLPPNVQISNLDFAVRYSDYQSLTGSISPVADYAVVGTIIAEQAEVSSGVLYFSKANADVKVIDLKTGREVASAVQTGVKGAGNDFNTANKAALKKCTELVVQDIVKSLKTALK